MRALIAGICLLLAAAGPVLAQPPGYPSGYPPPGSYPPGAPRYAPVPPLRYEPVPPPPGPQYVWRPGHWRWTGQGYAWTPGRYYVRQRAWHEWVPGHWASRHGTWVWVQPHWR